MKKIAVTTLLLASAVSMSACSTLRGGAIGAAGGAGVAAATGGNVEKGAAVGGVGGAVVGTVVDD
jgi:predicted small secreted protein